MKKTYPLVILFNPWNKGRRRQYIPSSIRGSSKEANFPPGTQHVLQHDIRFIQQLQQQRGMSNQIHQKMRRIMAKISSRIINHQGKSSSFKGSVIAASKHRFESSSVTFNTCSMKMKNFRITLLFRIDVINRVAHFSHTKTDHQKPLNNTTWLFRDT